ncbi:hypothetical protein EDB86DRAFT_3072315 [Lactarius hatsudake]|nr:hypothetical protein EDB86DRAFT_3072315 [Lactarius hatsudake]
MTTELLLAPMVRSGTFLTRYISLKYGAKLVWDPEIAMFACRTIEKSYLVNQVGSAEPSQTSLCRLRVGLWATSSVSSSTVAARNHFRPIRAWGYPPNDPRLPLPSSSLPSRRISVSADLKMRQLPTQQDTLALMERIANKGSLTIH